MAFLGLRSNSFLIAKEPGPEGAVPVMEGKSVLFKVMGTTNAIPLCISTQDKEEIVRFVNTT